MRLFSRRAVVSPAPLLALGTLFAAAFVLTAPPLPHWGERHTPHLHKPPLALTSGQTLKQSFVFEEHTLDRVVLWLEPNSWPTSGGLEASIESSSGVRTAARALADLPPSGMAVFTFPALDGHVDDSGVLRVRLLSPADRLGIRYQIASGIFPEGSLTLDEREQQGDLAFQLGYQRPALGGRGRQALAALALVAGGLVLAGALRHPRGADPAVSLPARPDLAVGGLLVLGVLGFYGVFLLRPGIWVGPTDFSKDAAYLASAADALRAGSWPIWNHRTCGGMALLGNPEGNTLSLGTLFALALPADRALLLLLVIEPAIGALGAFLLGRALGLSRLGSSAAALITALAGAYPYKIVEGLTPIGGAVAFAPWVFLFLHRALEESGKWRVEHGALAPASRTKRLLPILRFQPFISGARWAFLSGVTLALILHRGDVHVLVGVAAAAATWTLWEAVRRRTLRPLGVLAVVVLSSGLAASPKLLPYLEHPELIDATLPPYVLPLARTGWLDDALFGTRDRTLVVRPLHDKRPETWGNFGSTLGVPALVLAGIGVLIRGRSRWLLVSLAALTFLLAEGELFERVLRHQEILGSLLRIPTRLFVLFALFAGLLAGRGVDRTLADTRGRVRPLLAGSLLLLLTIDLAAANRRILTQDLRFTSITPTAFPRPPSLIVHRSDPTSGRTATQVLRGGGLLPKICGDQNNPPEFIRKLSGDAPLADVPYTLAPNRITLDAPAGPAEVPLRTRFVTGWTTNHGDLLPADNGGLLLVLRAGPARAAQLRFRDPLAPAEGVLLATVVGTTGLLLCRRRPVPAR